MTKRKSPFTRFKGDIAKMPDDERIQRIEASLNMYKPDGMPEIKLSEKMSNSTGLEGEEKESE